MCGLDEAEEGSIAVNVLPLLLAGSCGAKTQTDAERCVGLGKYFKVLK